MKELKEFLEDCGARHAELDRQHAPFENGAAAIDELQRRLTRMRAAHNESDHLELRRQLVNLMAHGCRAARDLGLGTEADAVALDDAELRRR